MPEPESWTCVMQRVLLIFGTEDKLHYADRRVELKLGNEHDATAYLDWLARQIVGCLCSRFNGVVITTIGVVLEGVPGSAPAMMGPFFPTSKENAEAIAERFEWGDCRITKEEEGGSNGEE